MTPTICINNKIYDFESPKVMGIINVTPDSFFSGSRTPDLSSLSERLKKMLQSEPDFFDIGGYSSRPGAADISPEEEWDRLAPGLELLRKLSSSTPISVDTFRASVARKSVENFGVEIINDISGGTLDDEMWQTVADLKCAYILMHMRGNPETMSSLTDYEDVTAEVLEDLAFKLAELHQLGIANVIIDPGFGFAKTVEQNFRLLRDLEVFRSLGCPLLAGLSRKSMIWKTLGTTPSEALNGTTALNAIALQKGADILRVHDVAEARECVTLHKLLR
ncbi:MAG: dihydropteroate synthase [Muribaculaceae bacterium]|nr:dihydropteroate synthase [Muribaculaceae bacterium]MDE6867244.1 dihydropteroate synthase [Muribaculaceae bacterium]